MFGFSIEEKIEVLEGYLKMSDIPNKDNDIANEIEDFNKEIRECEIKHYLKEIGYEKYTDEYVHQLKIEFYKELFDKNPDLEAVLKGLKLYMNTRNKNVFREAEMTFGTDPEKLSVEEMIYNEDKAKKHLNVIKTGYEIRNNLKRK